MATSSWIQNEDSTTEHRILLRRAIINRERRTILRILKEDFNWKAAYENGDTMLHIAMREVFDLNNQREIISILQIFLQRGLKVNEKNKEGKTILHLAIQNRCYDILDFLTKRDADMNIRDNEGNSIAHFVILDEFDKFRKLCYVCDQPHERKVSEMSAKYFVEWLIQNGLNINCKNEDQVTPLDLAINFNLQHVIPTLLEYTEDVNFIDDRNRNILHIFLESLTALNTNSSKSMTKASSIPTFCYDKMYVSQIVKMLLQRGVSVDAVDKSGNTPLHLAAKQEKSKVISLMLEHFTNVNACDDEGNTVLHIIIDTCIDDCSKHKEKYIEFVNVLLSKGANIHLKNKEGLLPVQLAALRRNITILQILENYGADFSVIHDRGNLLHFCTEKSLKVLDGIVSAEVIDYLITKKKMSVNAKNKLGMAPIHLALQCSGSLKSVIKLIEYGADVQSRELSKHRYTPLHLAVINNQYFCVEILLDVGADINVKDTLGRTPLHLAAQISLGLMANLLLRLGAHVDLKDDEGLLPLHLAVRHENFEGLRELLKFGADINDAGTIREMKNFFYSEYMVEYLLQQWFRLKTIGLPVNDDYMLFIVKSETFEYQKRCAEDVEILKTHFVGKNLSLYDILHMDLNNQCKFVKDIEDLLDPFMLHDQYPEYADVIFAVCHQAKTRQPLIWPAISAWYYLTDIYLPEFCVERIIANLDNVDLRNMIEGTKEYSERKSITIKNRA